MAASDIAGLFLRLQELHAQQGKTWKEIAHILGKEGYEEKGKALTDNALRKRYARWDGNDASGTAILASEPVSKQEQGRDDFDRFNKTLMASSLQQFEETESANSILVGYINREDWQGNHKDKGQCDNGGTGRSLDQGPLRRR
jgi:hypothetical protein